MSATSRCGGRCGRSKPTGSSPATPATAIHYGPSTCSLTRGARLGPRARRLIDTLSGHEEVGLKKWSLPVLAALDEPRRFSEIGAVLPEATPRAVTLALDIQAEGLVRRTVTDDYPPAVVYELTAPARPIAAASPRVLGGLPRDEDDEVVVRRRRLVPVAHPKLDVDEACASEHEQEARV